MVNERDGGVQMSGVPKLPRINPGTALSDEWRGHFFLATFTGNPVNSTIEAFALKPKGAAFELASDRRVDGIAAPVQHAHGSERGLARRRRGHGVERIGCGTAGPMKISHGTCLMFMTPGGPPRGSG